VLLTPRKFQFRLEKTETTVINVVLNLTVEVMLKV